MGVELTDFKAMSYATWKHYLLALAIMLILDALWIGLYFGGQYQKMIKVIQKGDEMQTRLLYFPFAYGFMILALFAVTLPSINPTTTQNLWLTSVRYGTCVGAAIY